jgi:type II secretory pathway predicted ATPase ExeA
MLLDHYKLAAQPFGVTPDPRFLFLSPTHREAMASLMHGIRSGRGFTALIAEPGMGKTTLLFSLQQTLQGTAKTAFLFQTLCGPREFLRALLADLGIEDDGNDFMRMHAKLNEYLLRESQQGRQLVVIIDEAQNLDEQVLEVVRMLSNFEASNKKLLHIVLAGQPQLAEKLAADSLTQLRQRISILARLAAFNAKETRVYIDHRLHLAGFAFDQPFFTEPAYAKIAEHSHGIPRNINNLCFNAMSLGCALGRRTVDASIVQETIDDLNLAAIIRPRVKSRREEIQATSQSPLTLSESERPSSAQGRLRAVFAIALLALMGWPAYRAGEFTRTRILPGLLGTILRLGTNHTVKEEGRPGNPWLKDPKHIEPGQILRIPASHHVAQETQSSREPSTVPPELAAYQENR